MRVCRVTYNGLDLIDARVYLQPGVPGEEPGPTRKGLCLQPEAWREVLVAMAGALGYGEPQTDDTGTDDADGGGWRPPNL